MSSVPSKFKKAFTAAAADIKDKLAVKALKATGVTVGIGGLVFAVGGSVAVAAAATPVVVGVAIGSFGVSATKAAYKAYKNG